MIDIDQQIRAIGRRVAQQSSEIGAAKVTVSVSRHYSAEVGEVWAALCDPERVSRWFLPLTGDLREGGTFQLEGNASGDILTCDPAGHHLVVTFGGPDSVVDLRLSAEGRDTVLEFDHTVPIEMAGSSAGALYVGPGWDGAVLALARYFAGEIADDPVAAASSPEAQAFCVASIDVWAGLVEASGTTDADAIATARRVALDQFAPDVKRRH